MSEDHPSEILIARFVVGKASEEEARRIDEHVRACDRCRSELDGAQAAKSHFDSQVFPRTLPAIEKRAARPALWLRGFAFAAMAVGAAVFLFAAPKMHRPGPDEPPEIAFKGGGTLKLWARRDGRVFAVEPSTVLRAGDQVRFAVQAGSARYALIASIDGRGQASIYFPSTALTPDAGATWQFVGESIALDDADGPERIFAVFSDERLDDDAVLPTLRQAATRGIEGLRNVKRLPMPWAQASVLFEKAPKP